MQNVSARFAVFLSEMALIPYNDATEAYLRYLIKVEERSDTSDQTRIDNLNKVSHT